VLQPVLLPQTDSIYTQSSTNDTPLDFRGDRDSEVTDSETDPFPKPARQEATGH